MKTTRDFIDFSPYRVLSWEILSLVFPHKIEYGYDKKQKRYYRKVKNVSGELINGTFYPDPNPFVNYPQLNLEK